MSAIPIPEPVLAAASNTPAVEPERLNSERIAARFGNCGIEILAVDGELRRTNLYSGTGNDRTCRTYALVETRNAPEAIQAEHDAILSGQSIGATFQKRGWRVSKRTLLTASVEPGSLDSDVLGLMQISPDAAAAAHLYELLVDKDGGSIHYATILELHHPDYLGIQELERLFPSDLTISPDTLHELLQVFGLNR